MAYVFDFDSGDGRNLGYVRPALTALRAWQSRKPTDILFATTNDGQLYICDLRPSATRSVAVLTGAWRQVYEFCDQVRNRRAIAESLGRDDLPAGELDAFLREMVDARLILREGDQYLSLAVHLNMPIQSQ